MNWSSDLSRRVGTTAARPVDLPRSGAAAQRAGLLPGAGPRRTGSARSGGPRQTGLSGPGELRQTGLSGPGELRQAGLSRWTELRRTGLERLGDLAELVRAPAALSVPGDVLVGAATAGTVGRRTPGLAAASVCLYLAGMAANDWADRELDAVERPQRPIPSGRVTPNTALGLAAGLTTAGLGLAAWAGGRRALAVAAPLAGAVWAYDLLAKNGPAGPAAMAACRGLDVLLGATGGSVRRALPAAATVAAHTYTVTALSRRETQGADRRLPVATLAGTLAVAATAAGANRRRGWRALLPVALAGLYLNHYGRPQARAARQPDASRVRDAVGSGITGLPTLQAALTARHGASLPALVLTAAAPLARRLARRISPT